ncbi:POK18 protein, partial [Calyptomena viridis]|nr:POK18 protein [Calyptomena viridis]
DAPKFAFTVPAVNNSEPSRRYQWTVLPQGMKNSPTICQWYVAQTLSTVCEKYPTVYCYHYMNDILVAASTVAMLQEVMPVTIEALRRYGLQIAPEKVQRQALWKYLGLKILDQTVQPQTVTIQHSVKTLNDLQKLLGTINWLRPILGLSTTLLAPLFDLLKGDSDLLSHQTLVEEAQKVLRQIELAITERKAWRVVVTTIPLSLYVLLSNNHPLGLIAQWCEAWDDPLHFLEWVFLSYQQKKTVSMQIECIAKVVCKARQRCIQLLGQEPVILMLPLTTEYLDWCMAHSAELQMALLHFPGRILLHHPAHKFFQMHTDLQLAEPTMYSLTPLKGRTIFTNGS